MEALEIKKQFHKFIDSLPETKLPKLYDLFINIIDEEDEELTEEDRAELKQARKDLENGETFSFEEVFKDRLDNNV